jgi:hypothetical protein
MTDPAKTEPAKPSFVLGGSKTFSLPMYGLMVGVFALFLLALLALFAPEGRFQPALTAIGPIVLAMLGLAGAGSVTLGARDAMTKGVTSSNSTNALAAIAAQSSALAASVEAAPPSPEEDVAPEDIPPGMMPD